MIRTSQAIAAICAALVLASCGKDEGEPIPQRQAARLEALLQQVQRQSDPASCVTLLNTTIPKLESQAERLPDSVGSDTQETITDGIGHLRDLAESDCEEQQKPDETDSTESTSTDTTPSTTTDSEPSTSTDTEPSTSTDTEPSTSTETTPPDTTPPDNPGNGNGGSSPPGLGNGGTPPGQGKKGGKKEDKDGRVVGEVQP